jgi:hypothetical protein
MKPPVCAICESRSFDQGGIVYFKKRASDKEWDKRMKEEGMVGHPPYARWFCSNHYEKAESLRHMTADEAMRIMRS